MLEWEISVATVILTFVLFLLPPAMHGQEKVESAYFSVKIPDTWTYVEYSDTTTADYFGSGPLNTIFMTPVQFGNILLENKEGDDTTAILIFTCICITVSFLSRYGLKEVKN